MAEAFNAVVGFPRWTDVVSWSGGSWDTAYPVTNLSTLPLSRVARTSSLSASSCWCVGTLDKLRGVRALSYHRHNLTLQAKNRILLASREPLLATVNTGTDVITATGHTLSAGSLVLVWNSGGSLPTSSPQVAFGTIYYAGTIGSGTFKLYASQAAAIAQTGAIDFSTAGSGTHWVLGPILYDSGMNDVWPAIFPYAGQLACPEWEQSNFWDSKYTTEELSDTTWTRPFWLDRIYFARSIVAIFDDAANPAGHLDIGLFEVAQGTQFSLNYDLGAEYGFDFRTLMQQGLGGVEQFDRRNKARTSTVQWQFMPGDEALARVFEMLRQHDLDIPFLWFPNPDNPRHWLRQVWLARNVSPGPLRDASYNTMSAVLNLKEVL